MEIAASILLQKTRTDNSVAQMQKGKPVVFLNYSLSFIKQLIQSSVNNFNFSKADSLGSEE